ncbi:MAG: TauD/TfdA family dioxygenase [Ilumatobacteraceae bacterium]
MTVHAGANNKSAASALQPIATTVAWRGDDSIPASEFSYVLSSAELAELEQEGNRFLAVDPHLGTVNRDDFPLPVCAAGIAGWAEDLDQGRGFVVVRGLRVLEYSKELSGAIFFLLGLHLGAPMRQNAAGDVLTHVIATTDKEAYDPTVLSSRTTGALTFHSDSSDVVGLLCLMGAAEGGASLLASGATVYNEVVRRRPDLAPLLFEPFHWDWYKQDFDAPAATYESPMCSLVDGVLSVYGGSKMVFTAQNYPDVPRLTEQQREVLELVDEIASEPGIAQQMDFQPGDIQWLLNYTAMHSRTAYRDHPEPDRRRHLLRLWLERDVGRPIVDGFGKPVQQRQGEPMDNPTIAALVKTPQREGSN